MQARTFWSLQYSLYCSYMYYSYRHPFFQFSLLKSLSVLKWLLSFERNRHSQIVSTFSPVWRTWWRSRAVCEWRQAGWRLHAQTWPRLVALLCIHVRKSIRYGHIWAVCSRTFAENMFPNEDPYCSFEESYPFVKMYFCNFIRILKLIFTEHNMLMVVN